MKLHAKGTLLVIIVLIILIVIFTFPAILHLTHLLIGDGGDNYEYFSFQFIAAQKLKALEWPFTHTDIIRYPVGFNFGAGFESVITVLTGAILSLFINNVPAYNLTVLFLYFLNGFFSFILFKHISKSNLISIIGSIIYGFSFFVIARSAGHINLFFLGGFILLIYSFLRIKDSFSTKNILLMHFAGMLVVLGAFLYSIIFSISFLLCLPLLLISYPTQLKSVIVNAYRNKYKILLLAIPFLVVIFIFSYPHINALITGNYNKPVRNDYNSMFYASPSLKDYILPNSYLPLVITNITKGLNDSARGIDKSVFLGWVEIILFICFLIFYKNRRLKYFLTLSALMFFILTLGFLIPSSKIHLPYYYIHNLPLFSFVDEPSRFYPVMYIFITTGIILFLSQIYKKGSKKTLFLFTAIATLLILERLPFNYWLTPTFKDAAYVQVVEKQNTNAVFDIPASYSNSFYHLLPYLYGKKVVSGTFQWFADTKETRSFIQKDNLLSRYICDDFDPIVKNGINQQIELQEDNEMISMLKKYGITTIVVHRDDKYYHPVCQNVRMRLDRLMLTNQELNATDKEKMISSQADNKIPEYTFSMPMAGTLFIDGLVLSPIEQTHFQITEDGKPISQSYTFVKNNVHDTWAMSPTYQVQIPVAAESSLTIKSDKFVKHGQLDMWYRYVPSAQIEKKNNLNPGFKKIYEDNDAIVYRLN